jgi:CRISPR-associated protein Csd1
MLQALREYGATLDSEPGFRTRELRWCIDLAADGRLLGLLPLGDGRVGTLVGRCPDMHNMNAGGRAHFLVESAQTIALHLKPGEDAMKVAGATQRHRFYANLVKEAEARSVEVLQAVSRLLGDEVAMEELRARLSVAKAKPTDWVGWRVEGQDPLKVEAVQRWWREWREADLRANNKPASHGGSAQMVCLLSGQMVEPMATHPKVSGLAGVGGLSMGDVVVGCDKAAFTSFGLVQSNNAAVGAVAAQQYADGLNDLIRRHSYRLNNSLCTYWFKHAVPAQDDPFAMLQGLASSEQQSSAALSNARALLAAIRSGKRADLGNNHFYALTISGAAGRVMVRDWMEGQFERLVANVEAWFSDLSVVARDGAELAPDPKFLAVAAALAKELDDVPGASMASLWHAAVARQPIPRPLMAQALHRFRLPVVTDDALLHARVGLIKCYFVRCNTGDDSQMKPHLNPEHPEPAYHCGRLLAVMARLQHAALGDVGASVVQRFYPAASQTPGLTLGRLIGNSRNHLGKLDGGLAFWFEDRIAEIMSRLQDRIPQTLDLEQQGLFALGYYQQLADMRTGKASNSKDNGKEASQ